MVKNITGGIMLEIIIVFVCVFADQLSKHLIETWLVTTSTGSISVIDNVLYFTYARNYGAAFSIMQNMQPFFIVITFIACVAIIYMLFKNRSNSLIFKVASAMILGGAIGNLIDRIRLGYVIDFVDFRAINFAIFNVADACLVVGLVFLGIYYFFIEGKKAEETEDQPAKDNVDERKTAKNGQN